MDRSKCKGTGELLGLPGKALKPADRSAEPLFPNHSSLWPMVIHHLDPFSSRTKTEAVNPTAIFSIYDTLYYNRIRGSALLDQIKLACVKYHILDSNPC